MHMMTGPSPMVREAGEGRDGQIKDQVYMHDVPSLFFLLFLLFFLDFDVLTLHHEP